MSIFFLLCLWGRHEKPVCCIELESLCRWRGPFWSGQEERPCADDGPPSAAGPRVSADGRGCGPPGQPQRSRCSLCSGRISTSTVQQRLLHHLHTREHARRTAVSSHNTQESKFHVSTRERACHGPLAEAKHFHGFADMNSLYTHTFSAGCASPHTPLTPTDWFSSVTFPLSVMGLPFFVEINSISQEVISIWLFNIPLAAKKEAPQIPCPCVPHVIACLF